MDYCEGCHESKELTENGLCSDCSEQRLEMIMKATQDCMHDYILEREDDR